MQGVGDQHRGSKTRALVDRVAGVAALALAVVGCRPDPSRGSQELIPEEAVAWLDDNAIPIRTDLPDEDFSDLEPLRELIGDARVVALGEATHGTAEFFRMKDRMLRFLVREMGFNGFAIEASWPELNRIDDYVRTGEGDPVELLSGQYFWTWNTQEVLDMILWVRSHNEREGADSPVSFLGFDAQYPGMGIHNVEAFVAELAPDLAVTTQDNLACIKRFANEPDGSGDRFAYADQSEAVRDACRADLEALMQLLLDRREALVSASSERQVDDAIQSLRTVIQFEDLMSDSSARDFHMAENTLWILDQLGPDAKLVVWAHNFHVALDAGVQGRFLADCLGSDYVTVGFSFLEGSATAVNGGRLGPTIMPVPPADSYEAYFDAAAAPRFVLDMRGVAFDTPRTMWLAGPRPFREIGCCLGPGPHTFDRRLPERFDAVIFFDQTSSSDLLPFNPPSQF